MKYLTGLFILFMLNITGCSDTESPPEKFIYGNLPGTWAWRETVNDKVINDTAKITIRKSTSHPDSVYINIYLSKSYRDYFGRITDKEFYGKSDNGGIISISMFDSRSINGYIITEIDERNIAASKVQ